MRESLGAEVAWRGNDQEQLRNAGDGDSGVLLHCISVQVSCLSHEGSARGHSSVQSHFLMQFWVTRNSSGCPLFLQTEDFKQGMPGLQKSDCNHKSESSMWPFLSFLTSQNFAEICPGKLLVLLCPSAIIIMQKQLMGHVSRPAQRYDLLPTFHV